MYQTINETIEVAGVFSRGKFAPRKFRWGGREHVVTEVTLSNDVKDGGVRYRYFSLVSGGTVHRVSWNQENHEWRLLEVWYDG